MNDRTNVVQEYYRWSFKSFNMFGIFIVPYRMQISLEYEFVILQMTNIGLDLNSTYYYILTTLSMIAYTN